MSLSYISANKAAKLLGVANLTIHKWFQEGRFPNAFCLDIEKGQAIKIPRSEVEALKQQPFKQNA